MANTKVEKIVELRDYAEGNIISKGLRWVKPATNSGRSLVMLMLDKDNNFIGFYSGAIPILFDEKYKTAWQYTEVKEKYSKSDYVKLVSNEEMLLAFCSAFFNFAKEKDEKDPSVQFACPHIHTKFKSLADATCPECTESVSPNLVMGTLLMHAGELNELMWEKRLQKDEKEAKVAEPNEGE